MTLLLDLSSFPLAHQGGFGINTNILETNIINLAAVVGIVVTFVGQNLTATLEDRKNTILKNLQEANQRALEAQQKLEQARQQLALAQSKAQEIRQDGNMRLQQEMNAVLKEHEARLARLNEFKQETVQFYQQKAFKQASLYVISRMMSRVKERLTRGLDQAAQVQVNTYYLSRFAEQVK